MPHKLSFLKPTPTPKMESRVWRFPLIFREILLLLAKKRKALIKVFQAPSLKKMLSPKYVILEEDEKKQESCISLLDLPDLVLDCILEKLSPAELCSMAGVCFSLRDKCTSDHLWQKLLKRKWGEAIGHAAYREWQSQIPSLQFLHFTEKRSKFLPFSTLFRCKLEMKEKKNTSLPYNSLMSCYLALESGKFWFPAQVFNRENGHVGFMLSCYDAQLSYGSTTDNFVARYKAQGRSMIEEGIEWKRIRAPSVDTPANVLHISSCLDDLKPNDHIEIQWRKNKDFPYGWWYGVVAHLDSCSGNELSCRCHLSDTIVLEFKQYAAASRWRKAEMNRKSHREIGNEVDGFYGGIRKLSKEQEIQKWKQLWPNCTLE
ncbi:F-box protein At2g32560-like isoform X2 [Salvia miltiorrhiza]|uniref:F-box protein At2g32560-like isoform X2 n=1 Tax=Salvia miltiorrhiza TaxID=226208 RepID=UPI0025AD33BF|nr:F-box protein At2g32560-like isoform X2 [Salvia miltiorrhiza]